MQRYIILAVLIVFPGLPGLLLTLQAAAGFLSPSSDIYSGGFNIAVFVKAIIVLVIGVGLTSIPFLYYKKKIKNA